MEPDARYKIDVRDRLHPVVYLNSGLPSDALAQAYPEAIARLCEWARAERRTHLGAAPELVEDEEPLDLAAPTADGESGCEQAAVALRATMRLVRDE